MQVHVYAKPLFPVPHEQLADLAERAAEWQEHYGDNIETLGMFPGGGGFAVVEVRDESTLNEMVLDMPFSPFSAVETRPFVDGHKAWKQLRQVAERMPAAVRA